MFFEYSDLNFFNVVFFNYEIVKLLFFLSFSFCIVGILYCVSYFISSSKISNELLSEYECGFEPFDDATRQPFDVHYYIVGILFLIFDVEIALIFPWVLNIKMHEYVGFWTMIIFLIIITIGFFYEWQLGALQWPRYNMSTQSILLKYHGFMNIVDHEHSGLVPHLMETITLCVGLLKNVIFQLVFVFSIYYVETVVLILALNTLLLIVYLKKTNSKSAIVYYYASIFYQNNEKLSPYIWFKHPNSWDKICVKYQNCRFFQLSDFICMWRRYFGVSLICLIFPLCHNLFFYLKFILSSYFYSNIDTPAPSFESLLFLYSFNSSVFCLFCILITMILINFIFEMSTYNFNWKLRINMMEFYFFMSIALFFFITLIKSTSLIILFVCIIGFSISSYLIIMTNLHSTASREAAIKYYYLSVLSSMLMAFGIVIIFVYFGTANLTQIDRILYYYILYNQTHLNFNIQGAILFILFGFFFKLNCFPCHWWSADIYNGLTYNILSFFVLPVKFVVFITFVKVLMLAFLNVYFFWQFIVFFSAIGSIFWGSILSLYELRIKKFIALSSISQFGFILIGLLDLAKFGAQVSFFYLFIYILTTMNLLTIFISIGCSNLKKKTFSLVVLHNQYLFLFGEYFYPTRQYLSAYEVKKKPPIQLLQKCFKRVEPLGLNLFLFKEITFITDLKQVADYSRYCSYHLCIIFFSMTSIPPLAGFFTKFYIFLISMTYFDWFLLSICCFSSLLGAFYYLRFIKIILFESVTQIFFQFKHVYNKNLFASRFMVLRLNNTDRRRLEIIAGILSFLFIFDFFFFYDNLLLVMYSFIFYFRMF